MKKALFLALLFLPTWANAQYSDDMGDDIGPGFVEVQGGQMRILGSGHDNLAHGAVVNLNAGFSLLKEFKKGEDYEPLKVGPKLGVIFGQDKIRNKSDMFYDMILNFRFSFGEKGDFFRLSIEGGPGAITYAQTAFEVDAGLGGRLTLGTGTFGVHGHYKEVFGSPYLNSAFEILASLGYQF